VDDDAGLSAVQAESRIDKQRAMISLNMRWPDENDQFYSQKPLNKPLIDLVYGRAWSCYR
jgi:hypothetical protein